MNMHIAIMTMAGLWSAAALAETVTLHVGRPLCDPAVTYDAETKTYYLTGTAGSRRTEDGGQQTNGKALITKRQEPVVFDFENNDGIYLWKSADLVSWEEIGRIGGYANAWGRDYMSWVSQLQPLDRKPDGAIGHALTAAELHRIGNRWIVCFAKNRLHAGLLMADRAAGPYSLMKGRHWYSDPAAKDAYARNAQVSPHSFMMAGDPSLLVEGDDVYLVWGPGWIARLKSDWSGWAEEPRSLQSAIEGWPNTVMPWSLSGENGATVVKRNGVYYFVFSATINRDGGRHEDTLVCRSGKLFGPYSKPALLIPDGGQAKFFEDPAGWRVSCMREGQPVVMDANLK